MDIFSKDPSLIVAVVAILAGSSIAVIAILAYYWHVTRRNDMEGALKQDMLNRGLSVDEIERVIKASSQVPDTISANEYSLIEKMVDEGKSAEEIERVLRVCHASPAALAKGREAAEARR